MSRLSYISVYSFSCWNLRLDDSRTRARGLHLASASARRRQRNSALSRKISDLYVVGLQ